MICVIDACVFVAASRPAEKHYAESIRFLEQIQQQQINLICPSLVLAECAATIARATGDPALAETFVNLIQGLRGLSLVPITESLARQAATIAAQHRLRGADSIYVATAK